MKKSKLIKYPGNLLIPIILILTFSSCSENPVTPKKNIGYQFDSARFNWRVDTVPDFCTDIWGIDTSSIYFLTPLHMLKYDGKNYQPLYYGVPNLSSGSFGGINENNLYIGCQYVYGNYGLPGLLKYNGISFEVIHIDSLLNNGIQWIYAYNLNETWMGTNKGWLLKYDGINIQYFLYDTNYYVVPRLKILSGELLVLAYSYTKTSNVYQILKFNNGIWHVLFSIDNPEFFGPFKIENELIASKEDGFYKFEGNNFTKIVNTPNYFTIFFDGSSETDILCFGEIYGTIPRTQFHWNGNKWSKEITYDYFDPMWIRKIQNKYVAVWDIQLLNRRLILYGTPKNK